MAAPSYGRAILGRGCDPVRARFAQTAWAPILKADVFCATSDEELLAHLQSGTKFSAFFVAPGYCSLAKAKRVDGPGMFALVERYVPNCPVVMIENVEHGLAQLAAVLGNDTTAAPLPTVKRLTADWPFAD